MRSCEKSVQPWAVSWNTATFIDQEEEKYPVKKTEKKHHIGMQ